LRRVQESLATSESRLRAIVEAAVDFGIIAVDEHGIILDWNSGAENMFGYHKHEVIGKNTDILFTPEDRHARISQIEIETAKKAGRSMDERWHMHKDGSRFFISGVMTPARDGGMNYFVKIARNITDRKLAEEALLMSEQRKSLAVQSAEMGEWEWELSTNNVKISNQVILLLGLQAGQINISPDMLVRIVYPEDEQMVRHLLNAALEGLNIFQAECRIIRADNKQLRWVNLYGRVVAHNSERPSKMIGVLYDITPRKVLEQQKDDFISMASHELKTPVTAIKSFSELLEESLEETSNSGNVALLRKLNRQVDRLIALMQNLLDSSNLSQGRIKLYPETFDINEAINDHLQILKAVTEGHHLKLNLASVPLIHADRERILQVINNFVANAAKYSPENSEIVITTEDQLHQAYVAVKDEGIGITDEAKQFVFERYYRGDHPAGKKGFGLGLYICSEIIKQHYGTIGLSSSPGQGSTFYFTLPYS
jgi:two-component system, chemotaxis family, CheB/CheR fusion protein